MDMISNKLLSEVFGLDVLGFSEGETINELCVSFENGDCEYINIYELVHKCKEWARKNGYRIEIQTYILHDNVTAKILGMSNDFVIDRQMLQESEPEAVFKACQWILNYKTNKGDPSHE